MAKTGTLFEARAAALAALLGLGMVVAAPAWAQPDRDTETSPEWPAPEIYTMPLCVVAIHTDAKFISLMDPDRENPVAAVSFAYKEMPKVKVGDLITVTPAAKTSTGQPDFKVSKAADPRCKKFIGE